VDRNLRLLGVGAAIRTFGNALYFPFLALFLYTVLHVGYLELGVLILGVGLVQLPFSVVGGLLTDRIGRRRLILLGLIAETIATLGLGYAFAIQSLPVAILAAASGGAVASLSGPAASAYIADFAEGAERTRGFTWFRIGFNAGFSAGVTLGGVLVTLFGFVSAVELAALVIGTGTVFLAFSLQPSPYDRALMARVSPAPTSREVTPAQPGPSVRQSLSVLARDKVALEVALALALGMLVYGQWAVTFPLYVHNILGVSYSLLGVGLALNGLVVVFGQTITTESMIGHRHTTIAIAAVALYALAFLGLGLAGLWLFFPTVVFFLAVFVLTIGENLSAIPTTTLPSNLAPTLEVGSYNGAFQTISGLGFLLAVLFGGVVLASTTNPLLIWVYLTLPGVPAVVLLRHAARRMRPGADLA
jgi:MFS family permease